MIRHFPYLLLCAFLAGCGAAHACNAISGDKITGRDFAAAVPELASIPGDLDLGYAPVPGVERVISAAQLQHLAQRYSISAKFTRPVCFAWPMRSVSKEQIVAAVRKSLGGREVEIRITEQSRLPVPEGDLEFPLQGLSVGAASSIWNGYIVYAGNKRFNTWARVEIKIHEEQIVAEHAIRSGETIDSEALKKVNYFGPLLRAASLPRPDEVIGKYARVPIAAGTIVTANMLAEPRDVSKDDTVTVHSYVGAAHIEAVGIASEAGYKGDVIRVRNSKTGRTFRARIDERDVVTVVGAAEGGLVVDGKKS